MLVLLSDPSVRGLDTVARVLELADGLGTKVGKKVFAFTRVPVGRPSADSSAEASAKAEAFREGGSPPFKGLPPDLLSAARARGLPDPLIIPEDAELRELDAQGKPLVAVSEGSAALAAVKQLLQSAEVLLPGPNV